MSDLIARLEGLAANMRGALVEGAETPAEAAAELTRLRAKVEAADKLAEAVEAQEDRSMCGCDGHRCSDCIRRDDILNAALSAYEEAKG